MSGEAGALQHIFLHCDVIITALSKLREWTGGKEGWRCRWFLTDDSATEQRAVREAWPGLIEGCQVTGHLLCSWHFEQTLRRRFKALILLFGTS